MSETPQARIASLRSAGAWRFDPVRFHYLEALARRVAGQGEPLRALLHEKLAAALADYERRLPAPPAPAPSRRAAPAAPACTPLAELNAQLRQAASARARAVAPDEAVHEHELASVRRFRQAWHASRSVEQVEQALERRPANAGPLNSHALVLQSLALMRELSPDYLRRFLTQLESLQWLEHAGEKPAPARARAAAAKAPRRARSSGGGA